MLAVAHPLDVIGSERLAIDEIAQWCSLEPTAEPRDHAEGWS